MQNDFSRGSVSGNIIRLAVPLMLAQLVNVLYNVVDRVFIGHIGNSALPLTGVGLCMPVITVISAFSGLFGMGGAPICSMARGRGDIQEAEQVQNTSFVLLVGCGLLLTILGELFLHPILTLFGASAETMPYATSYLRIYLVGTIFVLVGCGLLLTILGELFLHPILTLFGASAETMPYATSYLRIYLVGTIFVMIALGMNYFINTQGFAGIGMLTVSIGAVLNLILDPLFIFVLDMGVAGAIALGMNYFINTQGFAGIGMLTVSIGAVLNLILDPLFIFVLDMGVAGAALATICSQAVSALWALGFLFSKRALLRLRPHAFRWEWHRIRRIIGLGMSNFIAMGTNGVVQIACNSTAQAFGGDLYVGVMTVLIAIREVVQMPVSGLTNGAQPVISFNYGASQWERVKKAIRFSFNYGASQWERVKKAIRFTVVSGVIYATACWAILFFFPAPFVLLFNDDPNLVSAAIPALHLYFFGYFMMSLQFTGQSVFVALGRSKHAIFFSLFRKIIIVVPLTLILPHLFGYFMMSLQFTGQSVFVALGRSKHAIFFSLFRKIIIVVPLTLILPHLFGLGVTGVFLAEPISNFVGGAASSLTMYFTQYRKLGKPEKV